MPDVPKIVYDRLRAGVPADASHPDPNLLTAFAEHSLSAPEREIVLNHLAWCVDCRELAAMSNLALEKAADQRSEESESTIELATKARRQLSWFAWPRLRWAALAAGLVVAAGILLTHPRKPSPVQQAKQEPANAVTQPQETIAARNAAPAPEHKLIGRESGETHALADRGLQRDKESQFGYAVPAPTGRSLGRGQYGMPSEKKDSSAIAGGAVGAIIGGTPINPAPVPQIPAVNEAVTVNAAAPLEAETQTANVQDSLPATTRQPSDFPLSGRQVSDLAIVKAKPAKTESNEPSSLQQPESLKKQQRPASSAAQKSGAAASMNRLAANVRADDGKSAGQSFQWAIHENDVQRSLDSGGEWKAVFHSDRPLLSYATSGNDVWVGGKAGDLFHSPDGGVTWKQVHPSVQQQLLSDDITHIGMDGPSRVKLLTSNHQSWHSADGGNTWEKE